MGVSFSLSTCDYVTGGFFIVYYLQIKNKIKMNPTPIPKSGTTRHFYCEVCKGDLLHIIRVHKLFPEKEKIQFWALCVKCWSKHSERIMARDKYPDLDMNVPDFILDLKEMSFNTWNEFIKYGGYE